MIFVRRWIVLDMFGLVIISMSIIPPAKDGISEECEMDMMQKGVADAINDG